MHLGLREENNGKRCVFGLTWPAEKLPFPIGKQEIHFATVDERNPANQLMLVLYPIVHRGLYIPGGFLAGFLKHQEYDSMS